VLVRVDSPTEARALDLIPITPTLAVGNPGHENWNALLAESGVRHARLAAQRHPLLNQVGPAIALDAARSTTGLKGEGVIIGIVDTGIDASHPAMLKPNGKSRVAWLLAFGQEPRGLHPELEEEYGCLGDEPCAVLSASDLDEIIDSRILAGLPKDPIGHGTHIASLAAGRDDDYPGVAPAADLVVVAAAESDGAVSDARILLGTKFVFDRATERNQPAVVNVSLGWSFGAHDGTSMVEQGLAELGQGEGRAIVIASGNSGAVYDNLFPDFPGPLGVHTEVTVEPQSEVRVPVITPGGGGEVLDGSFFVWISTRPGDELSVGFFNGETSETNLVGTGQSGGLSSSDLGDPDDYDVVILNGVDEELDADVLPGSSIVAVAGSWQAGRVFEIVLHGDADARIWVTGTGDVSALSGGYGPLLPRARRAGTVAVPGSQRDLITVGSTTNRNQWTSYAGGVVDYSGTPGERSVFSGAGPNQNGVLKPDLVAPGGAVIGAMAREADPRTSLTGTSQFSAIDGCGDLTECFVVDDEHAVASGTSMSSPIVAGAAALLMQRDTTLTMEGVKRLLMAGTRVVPGEGLGSLVGAGQLDIENALIAQERQLADVTPSIDADSSRVVWSESFAYPGTGPALKGYIMLRDAEERPVRAEDSDINVHVSTNARAQWEVLGLGLAEITVTADDGSYDEELTVEVTALGRPISQDSFPIERDPHVAEHGFQLTGGTCATGPTEAPSRWPFFFFLSTTWALWRRRRAPH
jgi:subtilisin family serine protease